MFERTRRPLEQKGSFDEQPIPVEEKELKKVLLLVVMFDLRTSVGKISSYDYLARITAWILRFINNARKTSE